MAFINSACDGELEQLCYEINISSMLGMSSASRSFLVFFPESWVIIKRDFVSECRAASSALDARL